MYFHFLNLKIIFLLLKIIKYNLKSLLTLLCYQPNLIKISSSQILCVTAREILGRLCHGGAAAPNKHPPRPQPQKLLSRKQLASLAAAWRLFRDVATNKSHISSVKRVIKKLLLLAFLLLLLVG